MAAMVLCILLLLGEPAVMALMNLGSQHALGQTWSMRVSPLEAIWQMTDKPSSWLVGPWRERVLAVAAAAVAAWIIVAISARKKRPQAQVI